MEEGVELALKFDARGLMPCVTTDATTGDVLMMGYMNDEAHCRPSPLVKPTTGAEAASASGTRAPPAVSPRE